MTISCLLNGSGIGPSSSTINKIGYLRAVRTVKRVVKSFNPDVIHAHYASSYGLICSLAVNRPYYLSIWGSDIYDFPRKSPLHRLIIEHALKRCAWPLSTSYAMAVEAKKYTDKGILITPFGVDMKLFSPIKGIKQHKGIVVGTVKALERKYGIDVLLRAVSLVSSRRPDLCIRLRIAGSGSLEDELKALASNLKLDDCVTWLGFVSQKMAAQEWGNFDIGVVPSVSESESFGVSAVECQACGTPLIISDIPGLLEACNSGKTSLVVPRGDYSALADAIEELADDSGYRSKLGERGRSYVVNAYEIDSCFKRVESLYFQNIPER